MKQSKEKKVSRLQVTYTDEYIWRLRAEAALRQMDLGDFIQEAVREYVASHPAPGSRQRGAPDYKGPKRKDEKAS